MKRSPKNVAASVHARLLNKARAEGRAFNELLQYYAMERFLYRLSRSKHSVFFVLKGALMLRVWGGPAARATKDIDLSGPAALTMDELVDIIADCMAAEVADDGLRFSPDTLVTECYGAGSMRASRTGYLMAQG